MNPGFTISRPKAPLTREASGRFRSPPLKLKDSGTRAQSAESRFVVPLNPSGPASSAQQAGLPLLRAIGTSRPPAVQLAAFYLVYLVAAGVAQALAVVPGTGISMWPPSGVLLAVLLLQRRETWLWWILAGSSAELTGNLVWFHNPLPVALVFCAGNALEGAFGACLLNRYGKGAFRLETVRDVLALLLLGAGVGPVVAATVGAAALVWSEGQPLLQAWSLLWIGDATGVLVAAPLGLVIGCWRRELAAIPRSRTVEGVVLAIAFMAVALLALSNLILFAYMVTPVLLWAAVRFEFVGAVLASLLLAVLSTLFAMSGVSPFEGAQSPLELHVTAQLFLAISASSSLIVAAISRQHREALAQLQATNEELERRVAERTASLRASEQRASFVLREVAHRSKNILALVQAVARQTAASDPRDFIVRFDERVRALAASQDLLVKHEWKEIDVASLVRSQLAHFEDLVGDRISMSGPPARLTAQAAQALGMALHELATNAGKYGALSNDSGRVEIAWTLPPRQGGGCGFAITWTESGGPPVAPPSRNGFGSRVIRDMARSSFEGSVELEFAPEGVRWRLESPDGSALERA